MANPNASKPNDQRSNAKNPNQAPGAGKENKTNQRTPANQQNPTNLSGKPKK